MTVITWLWVAIGTLVVFFFLAAYIGFLLLKQIFWLSREIDILRDVANHYHEPISKIDTTINRVRILEKRMWNVEQQVKEHSH